MSSISKYWEKYRESKKENVADKDSYISYLELQLEKVNQSLRMTQSFNERIENLQSQLASSEEKTMNLTRLVKLQQSFVEAQEEEVKELTSKLSAKHSCESISHLEARIAQLEGKISQKSSPRQDSLLEKRVENLEEFKVKTAKKVDRIEECEGNVEELQRFLVAVSDQIKKHDGLEDRISHKVSNAIDQMCSLVKDYVSNQSTLKQELSEISHKLNSEKIPSPRFGSSPVSRSVHSSQSSTPSFKREKKNKENSLTFTSTQNRRTTSRNSSAKSLRSRSQISPKVTKKHLQPKLKPKTNHKTEKKVENKKTSIKNKLKKLYEELSQKYD